MLCEEAWDDDEGLNFDQEVGFGKFTLEVKLSDGKMVVVLNNSEFRIYESIHIKKMECF